VSPTSNSSLHGFSPIRMPVKKRVHRPVSSKAQRHPGSRHPAVRPTDWTRLSLHNNEGPTGLIQFSALPRARNKLAGPHALLVRHYPFIEWDGMRVRMCF
jgi:hypothetical protein